MNEKKITLHDRTLIRKLVLDDSKANIVNAQGVHSDRPQETVEYRAKLFVVASGYTWSSHLLLNSACSRFPNGIANKAGQVGKYMNGHAFIQAFIELDDEIYPNMNPQYGLISRQYFRCSPGEPYVRHDLRIWEAGREAPRLKGCWRPYSFGRRHRAGLAGAQQARRGSRAGVLRCPSVGNQRS